MVVGGMFPAKNHGTYGADFSAPLKFDCAGQHRYVIGFGLRGGVGFKRRVLVALDNTPTGGA